MKEGIEMDCLFDKRGDCMSIAFTIHILNIRNLLIMHIRIVVESMDNVVH